MNAERKRRMIVVCALAVALVTISATSVFATHLFTDVSSSAFYHDDVDAIFNAGVTSGCGGAKYCPNNSVTRGQMAVFLDKLGALDLGPGGIPRTVVDALTDQGVLLLRFFQNVVFITPPGASACSPEINLPFQVPFGFYTIKHQLYDVIETDGDPAMETAKVNIGLHDTNDTAPYQYEICLAATEGTLSRGTYKLYGTMTVNLGQQLFGSSAGRAKARDAANKVRTAAQ